jgi:hypothetical protein
MTVAMKPQTRISFWLVAGSLLLSLSTLSVLSSQVVRGASFPAGIAGPSTAKLGYCRRVEGPVSRGARDAVFAAAPRSQKTPAGTSTPQRAVVRLATVAPVSIDCGPCREVPVAGHLRTVIGRPIVFSLQSQHVRIQI